MAQRVTGDAYRSITISIDNYHNEVMCGSLHHPHFESRRYFLSTMQLVKLLESVFTETNYPQAYTTIRSFARHGFMEPAPQAESNGAIATFHVRVLFRQNASWQGEILWEEKGISESFRSVLELLLLMDSALAAQA